MNVSVEFAHGRLGAIDASDVEKSVACAEAVVRRLQDLGHEVTTVVLLDDKTVATDEAETEAQRLLDLITTLGLEPDNTVRETTLRTVLDDLANALPTKARRRLLNDSHDYLEKFNNLPCSVDIALWHSLRLGVIGGRYDYDVVISILGDGDREFEELAQHRFLRTLPGDVDSKIIRLYYPASAQEAVHLDELLRQLDLAMKGATS